eukprot:CAMPEP_0198317768 /NCGR_PEP_ID=MMETSP1450-20131203/7202_1 /TAXON_ID=753684 ORGANISM="Madagascaria erythrocladiodes, Strain CCMP3234" /NCGR_SAMPLE_ID=MMETSP1450 /ASSEMBLY_ACC=CAM_ASM_001115 /LENGTH=348 /DNA_ID=CAMNT_0044021013 /DNA_START=34 /DNA_END=1080 /DNA_ORIENTATION=-
MTDSSTAAAGAIAWLEALGEAAQPGEKSHRHEALAMLVHSLLLRHGFRPEGLEESRDEAGGAGSSAEVAAEPVKRLPDGWTEGGYGGRYRHFRSAMTFEIRSVPVGSKLLVTGVSLEDESRMHSLELKVDDMVLTDVTSSDGKNGSSKWDGVFKDIAAVATLVQVNIAHKLVPDSAKDGYQEAAAADDNQRSEPTTAAPRLPYPAPLRDFDDDNDPLRIGPPRRPYAGGLDPTFPPGVPSVGRDDLMPGGLPEFGRMPPMGGPGFGGQGGNLLGPRNFGPVGPGRMGGFGGAMGGLPPGVPPGARFDPYGPPHPGGNPGVPDGTEFGGSRGVHPDVEQPGPPPPDMYW